MQAVLVEDWQAGGFGLYVHWPFCAAKCPYCDFNSHVTKSIDHDKWRKEFIDEIRRVGQETTGRVLQSVFFGGGTPSLMEPQTVGDILDVVHEVWPIANDIEVTLEANPTSVEASKFSDFQIAGVNRISMGIQALNDPDLRALGRLHTAQESLQAFDIARKKFSRVSFDLMYGRQNQSLADWEAELTNALTLGLDHVSLYQLTIEAGTAFGDRYQAGKLTGLPSEDLSADMYQLTQDICEANYINRYEVSNHATDGNESRHNLIYWRYGDYIGIGPGAHGRITINGTRLAVEQKLIPSEWLSNTSRETRELLTGKEQASEFLLMGLRLREGINKNRYSNLSGYPLNQNRIADLIDLNFIQDRNGIISTTKQGLNVLNSILRTLLEV